MSSPERFSKSKKQSTSDLEDNQPRTAKNERQLLFEMYLNALKARECPQNKPRTAKEWEREIQFEIYSSVSKSQKKIEVKQTELITDARQLFGSDMKRKVSLRTAADHRMGRPIVLKQFDPNLNAGKVVCRHPNCKIVKPESDVAERKRDLYLCLTHRKELGDNVKDICASKKVHVQVSVQPKKGIFEGYTSMIGYLDQAYLDCMKSPGSSPIGGTKDLLVKEAILNVRNYFMIVNAVLNPDDKNLGTVLPPVCQILIEILRHCIDIEFVKNLVYLLKEVVSTILSAFTVLYKWVSVAVSHPLTKIGAGLGGITGALVGGALGAVGGAVFGGMIGSGISGLFWGQSPGALANAAFSFTGSASGDLDCSASN